MGRGLSQLQKEIMERAGKGYIAPAEVLDWCGCWTDTDDASYKTHKARASATASRALRSLVTRGLLVYVRARWVGDANLYMLKGWQGPLPRVRSQHAQNMMMAMAAGIPSSFKS